VRELQLWTIQDLLLYRNDSCEMRDWVVLCMRRISGFSKVLKNLKIDRYMDPYVG